MIDIYEEANRRIAASEKRAEERIALTDEWCEKWKNRAFGTATLLLISLLTNIVLLAMLMATLR